MKVGRNEELLDRDFDFIDINELEELENTDSLEQDYEDFVIEGDLTQIIKDKK